jgi:hypothetical protein
MFKLYRFEAETVAEESSTTLYPNNIRYAHRPTPIVFRVFNVEDTEDIFQALGI